MTPPTPKRTFIGKRFGKLRVLSFAPQDGWIRYVNCLCDCGRKRVVRLGNLRSGNTKSCGCVASWRPRPPKQTIHPLYKIWSGMKDRCYSTTAPQYPRYGARGIVMCDTWKARFNNFASDIGPRPSKMHSIDRINNDDP